MEQPNTASRLAAAIRRAPRIKEQLPTNLLIPGNMTMPKYHHPRIWKLLSRYPSAIMRIPQNVDNAYSTAAYGDLAFNRQLQDDLFLLDVALHRHYGRNRFKLIYYGQTREVPGV